RSSIGWAISAIVSFGTSAALAQCPTEGPKPPSPTAAAQNEAQERFQRGIELSQDGNFDAALLEMRRAYELAPTYRILYNIGLIYQQLKQYARAYDALERYLCEGGASAEHADDATKRLKHLEGRVAYLSITTSEPNAEVTIDDLSVGRTPLNHAVRVDSG